MTATGERLPAGGRCPMDRKDYEHQLAALAAAARLDPDAEGLHR